MSGPTSLDLIAMFDRGVGVDPSAPCLETADGRTALTYRQVHDLTHRMAVGLARIGVGPRPPIGVLSPNDPIGFVSVLAVLRLGGTWIPVNAKASAGELRDLLDLCRCELVLCHERTALLGEQLAGDGRPVVGIGDGDLAHPDLRALLGPEDERFLRAEGANPLAALAGTGGTTGRPKAVMLGHGQLYAQSLGFMAHMPEQRPPVQIVAAPMTHTAGSITFPVLAVGGRSIVHDGVVAEDILASIQAHRVTRLYLPPTAIYGVLDTPGLSEFDLSSLQYFLYLAAAMSEAKLLQAIEAFGPVMCQTYGQTEAPTICTWFSREDHAAAAASGELRHRLRSCGRESVVAGMAIMGEDGSLLRDDAHGEIVIRGPLVMDGYLDDPAATAAATHEGWHRTGDIGYRDADGFFYLVDRSKDLIISGGFNVFPGEVERALLAHPAIRDCAVIGVPDEKWGEAVTAVVELRGEAQASEAELRAHCRQLVGPVKSPKQVIFEALPRSGAGKVLKRELRERFWAGMDRRV